jgi:hypothetical protein
LTKFGVCDRGFEEFIEDECEHSTRRFVSSNQECQKLVQKDWSFLGFMTFVYETIAGS